MVITLLSVLRVLTLQTFWSCTPFSSDSAWSFERTFLVFLSGYIQERELHVCCLGGLILQEAWYLASPNLVVSQSASSLQLGASQFRFEVHGRLFSLQKGRNDMLTVYRWRLRGFDHGLLLGLSRRAREGLTTHWDREASSRNRSTESCWSTLLCLLGISDR